MRKKYKRTSTKRELELERKLEKEKAARQRYSGYGRRRKSKKRGVLRSRKLLLTLFFLGFVTFLVFRDSANRKLFSRFVVVTTRKYVRTPTGRRFLVGVVRKSRGSYEKIKIYWNDVVGNLWYGEEDEEAFDQEVENPNSLVICSFNIRIFSNNSRDNEELNYITDILRKYDLIAIQELRDEKVLKRTVAMLKDKGLGYDYVISDDVGKGVKEKYAFLYRKNKVSVVDEGKIYDDVGDKFIREPYYATFRAGNFDFTLVTIHLLFGSSERQRRPEAIELATVYKKIQKENPEEQDIIMLGDFNFSPDDEGFDRLKSIKSMTYLIRPPRKTTISDRSLYDNFWFQKNFVKEYTGHYGVFKFDHKIFRNKDMLAKRAVSDHRPIWARFGIKAQDDD